MLPILSGLARKASRAGNGISATAFLLGFFLCALAPFATAQTTLPFSDNFQSTTLNPSCK